MEAARCATVTVEGELLGLHRRQPRGEAEAEIVRIVSEQRPDGPAENALVLVERAAGRPSRARYISWIGYYDIEEAQTLERGVWEVVEPAQAYRQTVEWLPFGWPGMQLLPSHHQ